MPVTKRVNRFEATIYHKGSRYRGSFLREEDAERWEMETRWALKHGKEVPPGTDRPAAAAVPTAGPNLWSLMQDTIKTEWKGTRNEKASSNNAELCVRFLGADRHPANINTKDINEMRLTWEAEGIAPGTVNRRLSALSKMLTHAVDTGLIPSKPRIRRPKEPQGRIRFLSPEEEQTLLDTMEGCITTLAIIAIDTGMRLSELLNLEGRDVRDRCIHLWNTKTDMPRTIPLTNRAWELLEFKASQCDGPLFPLWNVARFEYEWNKVREKMGLANDPQFVPHVMRHTFCSRLAQRGESPFVIMQLAGHRNIATTQRYVHMTTQNLRTAIDSLEESYGAKQSLSQTDRGPLKDAQA